MPRPAVLLLAALVGGVSTARCQVPRALSDSAYGALSAALAEPGGYFDTDNLVSNEDSYLHAITTLEKIGTAGGAYLGVGPDQNFSYIAAIRPDIAFILDIRRDNLVELVLYQSIFALARNRAEYLALLFGKSAPADTAGWSNQTPEALFEYISGARYDSAAAIRRVRDRARALGISLSGADLATLDRLHRAFITAGPGLRLTTFNRGERTDYPDFRALVLQTDLSGRRASYLASESAFGVVKDLEDRRLVVPVVGNFAGPTALRAIGRYLREHGETVSAFYTSNVEQYLVQDGLLGRFAQNVRALPRNDRSVFIRSFFPYGRPHALKVPGYLSVQIVQRMDRFLALESQGAYAGYYDLVTRDFEPR